MKLITLTRGLHAIVDDEDFELLSSFKWHAAKSRSKFYATRSVNGNALRLHNCIITPADGLLVDHINGDSLDNRKSNLRICTRSENVCNSSAKRSSAYLGVSFNKKEKRWISSIRIGSFLTEHEAAQAFVKAHERIHRTN